MATENIRGMTIEVRGLTRGELSELKNERITFAGIRDIEDEDERDAALDKIIAIVAPDLDPMTLTPAEHMDLVIKIERATYLGEGEIKKLLESRENGSGGVSAPATTA